MSTNIIRIDKYLPQDWKEIMASELTKPYVNDLEDFITKQYQNFTVFPSIENIFNAYKTTSFTDTKVVIVGQDPYHGKGQANGLAFSVNPGVKIPPSLRNIFKELQSDLRLTTPDHGDLTYWAEQGVLLINASLTVQEKKAGSHQKKGWEKFTDSVITAISEQKEAVVFILWGNFAISKQTLIDEDKHLILKTVHPSPLSAFNGFFGCHHFSKCNEWLQSKNLKPIDWQIKNLNYQLDLT